MDSIDVIKKFRSLIVPGNTIHIDGGFIKKKDVAKSNSSTDFDLKLMSNTQVNLIKAVPEFIPVIKKHGNFTVTTIENSVKHHGKIEIIAYMKQKIARSSTPSGDINQGCLSDCKLYKLEIRMPIVCDMSFR
ncbi:uncharacterized protein LOC131673279 [Phymastichus coffea]|uniref:uncharacterized protein LOC131673279 n=1 Tax=Phymastichus coffea TaxID=108790 RepID=UPI00273B8F67|nr:uncharacterized protein LOC131673279 [Phymastichus coffea]